MAFDAKKKGQSFEADPPLFHTTQQTGATYLATSYPKYFSPHRGTSRKDTKTSVRFIIW